MVVAGAYLLLTRVTVGSGLWILWGYNAFGFAPTSLFDTLVILGLIAGGIGLVARSLRAYS